MRFLHTGDWHVGRTIRGRSRQAEFAEVLDEVVAIAEDSAVDAVLVAGDIYDGPLAGPDADELVFDAFLRLRSAGIPVVAVAGNHDSPSRLHAWSRVLEAVGVRVVPRVVPPASGSVVDVTSRDGRDRAVVACVPFVPERRFGDAAALFDAPEAWHRSYAQGMGDLIGAMAAPFRPDRVNVMMAHLFADGAKLGGGEREASIAFDYAVSPSRFPGTASYIALGHIHRPQSVTGSPATARYAGSLLQLDFGETGHTKSVALVEAHPASPARVEEVGLSSGRRLRDLTGTLDELTAMAGTVGDDYLRVFVTVDGPVPGIAERIRDTFSNAVAVHPVYPRLEDETEPQTPLSSLDPKEQFLRYYRSHHGADPEPAVAAAFDEILELEQESA